MPQWTTKPPREPDDEGGFGDFGDDFSKLLEHLQPDSIPTGWPRYRKGGSPRNWDVEGDYNFVDPSGFVQIGTFKALPEVPVPYAIESVYYPMRYSGRPMVFVQCSEVNPMSFNWIRWNIIPYIDYFRLDWACSSDVTWVKFHWLAFGPGTG